MSAFRKSLRLDPRRTSPPRAGRQKDLAVTAAGPDQQPTAGTPGLPQVLLVCTANICRSPMAEVLWREAAAGRRRPLSVGSAGTEAEPGRPADGTATELMALRGLDLSDHRAERFRADLALDSELVLVMEQAHLRRILALAPPLSGRVHLLGRWTVGEISDPFRQETNIYAECIELLENSVKSWLNRLP